MFSGSASMPSRWLTRAAMGTAETPAEPIRGLILAPGNRFMILAMSTPEAVPMEKAMAPRKSMPRVEGMRNFSVLIWAPTPRPRKMVTMLSRAFWAVVDSRSTTPHSRIRLPNMKKPMSGAAEGSRTTHSPRTTSGKTIFSTLPTWRICSMRMHRSAGVVRARMIGG